MNSSWCGSGLKVGKGFGAYIGAMVHAFDEDGWCNLVGCLRVGLVLVVGCCRDAAAWPEEY